MLIVVLVIILLALLVIVNEDPGTASPANQDAGCQQYSRCI
jgi:competence protein ComGC